MFSYTLEELRSDVTTRYDLPDSTPTTKPTYDQLTRLINNAIRRFTNLLLTLREDEYLTTMTVVPTVAGVATVALPTRCFHLYGLAWIRSAGERPTRLRRATVDDLLDGGASPSNPQAWDIPPKYTLLGQTVSFVPVPSAVYSLRLVYAQLLATLVNDADTVDFGPGWDDWVINDVCAMIAKIREESPDGYIQDRMIAEKQIMEAASKRDDNEPPMARRLFDAGVRNLREGDLEGEYS
jgi:hypothetical protein